MNGTNHSMMGFVETLREGAKVAEENGCSDSAERKRRNADTLERMFTK